MTGHCHVDRSESIPSHLIGAKGRVDDQGYLHMGRSQSLPDSVVVGCGRTEERQ